MENLINKYIEWLKKEIKTEKQKDGWYMITTPFLDRHNDHIQFYAKETNKEIYYLTDFGEIIEDLELYGFDFKNNKLKEEILTIIKGFGVNIDWEKKELYVETDIENFPQTKHNFIQTIISIGDLYVLSKSRGLTFFLSIVLDYLTEKDISFVPNVYFQGSSLKHKVDIVIGKSKKRPELLIKTLGSPSKQKIESFLFEFNEIISNPSRKNSKPIIIINDEDKKINKNWENAVKNYNVELINWSEIDSKLLSNI